MYGRQQFEVNQIGWNYSQRIDRSLGVDSVVHSIIGNFAMGSQQRVEHDVQGGSVVAGHVPATNLDALKKILVEWDSTLRFGWLVPKMKPITCYCEKSVTTTYVNVMPLPPSDTQRQQIEYMTRQHFPLLTPSDWLSAEPPTIAEVESAKMTAREAAERMAYSEEFARRF